MEHQPILPLEPSTIGLLEKPGRKPCIYCGKDHLDYACDAQISHIQDNQIMVSIEGTEPVTIPQLIEINSEANGGIPLEESDIEAVRGLAIGEAVHIGLSEVKRIS